MAEPSLLGEWAIDPWHSSVAFTCQVNAMSSLDGRFDAFDGAVVFAPDGGHHAHGAVRTESIDTNLPQRDDVLRRPATFDAATYPEIRFAAREIVRGLPVVADRIQLRLGLQAVRAEAE